MFLKVILVSIRIPVSGNFPNMVEKFHEFQAKSLQRGIIYGKI